jgi:hypothetical protein
MTGASAVVKGIGAGAARGRGLERLEFVEKFELLRSVIGVE